MSFLEKRANHAIDHNGDTVNGVLADIHITTRGSDWYFTVTALMTVSTIAFLVMARRRRRQDRIFHYLTAGITLVAAFSYFTMGSNLGFVPILVEFPRESPRVFGFFRQIFYVRYIDRFIGTTFVLLNLLLTAGMPWPSLLWILFVNWFMVVCTLVGALVDSNYKWAYYLFGLVSMFYIFYELAWVARLHARALGNDVSHAFMRGAAITMFVWFLYPIAWGVSEGGNVIAPDSEAIFYGILDLIAKPVFGALFLHGHRELDAERLGLHIRGYSDDPSVRTSGTTGGGIRGPRLSLRGFRGEKKVAPSNGAHHTVAPETADPVATTV